MNFVSKEIRVRMYTPVASFVRFACAVLQLATNNQHHVTQSVPPYGVFWHSPVLLNYGSQRCYT
jgi:hypothetical protein